MSGPYESMATKRRQRMQYFSLDHSFVYLAVSYCVRPTGRMGGPGEPGPEDCSGKGCRPENEASAREWPNSTCLVGVTASTDSYLPRGKGFPLATGVAAISIRLRPVRLAA